MPEPTFPYLQTVEQDGGQDLVCPRCGCRERFTLPISLPLVVVVVKDFEKRHRGCKKEAREDA